jgi:lysophospholipase L1-like esterase
VSRTSSLVLVLVAMLLAALVPPATLAADPPPLPTSMAAVGDSITQAVSSGGSLGALYPANSWSTGTNSTVNSHYQRLLALSPAISGRAWNDSVSGADSADLAGQMAIAAGRTPGYLTVLIGGNDLCTDTVAQMTSVADFRARVTAAMEAFTAASPDTRILLVSIPRVNQLWELFRSNFGARTIWALAGICQSLLANPTSTTATDTARRAAVAQRNVDFNTVLAEVCAQHAQCRWDGNAVYNVAFTRSDVSGDYFHPSVTGLAKLASVTWAAGWWPNGGPVDPSPSVHLESATWTSAARKSGWTATVTVTAADRNGVRVAGALVTGTWTGGTTGSCTTATDGSCSFSLAVGRKATSVTWTIGGITKQGYTYDAAANLGSPVTVSVP